MLSPQSEADLQPCRLTANLQSDPLKWFPMITNIYPARFESQDAEETLFPTHDYCMRDPDLSKLIQI